eukprot:307195-Chlamydomonas_euryale.AAC.2
MDARWPRSCRGMWASPCSTVIEVYAAKGQYGGSGGRLPVPPRPQAVVPTLRWPTGTSARRQPLWLRTPAPHDHAGAWTGGPAAPRHHAVAWM